MKIEIELPEIEGFEYTGEYRVPIVGENYSFNGEWMTAGKYADQPRPILKKKAPKYRVEPVMCASDPRCLHGKTIKMVEIKALEDAMVIIERLDSSASAQGNQDRNYSALKELLK